MEAANSQSHQSIADLVLSNLLVREKNGQLKVWHSALADTEVAPRPEPVVAVPANLVLGSKVAPIDDNFAPISYLGKPAPAQTADFAFHPHDQQELSWWEDKLPIDGSTKYSIEKIANRIIDKHNLLFSATVRVSFTDILYDYFRSHINRITARQSMQKLETASGPLQDADLDSILTVARTLKAKIDAAAGLVIYMAKQTAPLNKVKTDALVAKKLAKVLPAVSQDKATAPTPVIAKTPVAAVSQPIPIEEPLAVKVNKVSEVKKITPTPSLASDNFRPLPKVTRPSSVNEKKSVHDVKGKEKEKNARPTPMGPVDELRAMDFVNWQRLGPDAESRAEKILNKINLLQKESITKKSQGISAWRQSSVYQSYLQIGQASLAQNKTIEQVIAEAPASTLSLAEFQAISDLNKKLRF